MIRAKMIDLPECISDFETAIWSQSVGNMEQTGRSWRAAFAAAFVAVSGIAIAAAAPATDAVPGSNIACDLVHPEDINGIFEAATGAVSRNTGSINKLGGDGNLGYSCIFGYPRSSEGYTPTVEVKIYKYSSAEYSNNVYNNLLNSGESAKTYPVSGVGDRAVARNKEGTDGLNGFKGLYLVSLVPRDGSDTPKASGEALKALTILILSRL